MGASYSGRYRCCRLHTCTSPCLAGLPRTRTRTSSPVGSSPCTRRRSSGSGTSHRCRSSRRTPRRIGFFRCMRSGSRLAGRRSRTCSRPDKSRTDHLHPRTALRNMRRFGTCRTPSRSPLRPPRGSSPCWWPRRSDTSPPCRPCQRPTMSRPVRCRPCRRRRHCRQCPQCLRFRRLRRSLPTNSPARPLCLGRPRCSSRPRSWPTRTWREQRGRGSEGGACVAAKTTKWP